MPASTAELVVSTLSLRWSSPETFNDPFDVPRELAHGYKPEDVFKATQDHVIDLMMNPPDDISKHHPDLSLLIQAAKATENFQSLENYLRNNIGDDGRDFIEGGFELLQREWKNYIPQMRILCLTEEPTHAAMWYHYADRYKGVVVGLNCSDELDSPWLLARPVDYPKEKPAHYTADGLAKIMCLNQQEASKSLMEIGIYTKSIDWAYEREWRVVSFESNQPKQLYSDYKFDPRELDCIYFGPLIDPDSRARIIKSCQSFPNVKLFDTKIGLDRDFHFNPCGG